MPFVDLSTIQQGGQTAAGDQTTATTAATDDPAVAQMASAVQAASVVEPSTDTPEQLVPPVLEVQPATPPEVTMPTDTATEPTPTTVAEQPATDATAQLPQLADLPPELEVTAIPAAPKPVPEVEIGTGTADAAELPASDTPQNVPEVPIQDATPVAAAPETPAVEGSGIIETSGPDFGEAEGTAAPTTPPAADLDQRLADLSDLLKDNTAAISAAAQPEQPTTSIAQTNTLEVPAAQLDATAATPAVESSLDFSAKLGSLDEILLKALEMKASDVHLSAGYRAMARVDGKLVNLATDVLNPTAIEQMLRQLLEDSQRAGELDALKEIDLAYSLSDSARFRINVFRQQGSLAAAFRLIPAQIMTLDQLFLPPIVSELAKLPNGLVLVTGPTGSGKSTTLASILNQINLSESKHIITIEDPVEYIYPKGMALVEQREIYQDTASWTDALKYVLRQDPDVVMIGEMRDLETIAAAITVAETGHLVFATLHTSSGAQSIDRMIDVFPAHQQSQIRTQLATVLKAVMSQRLVPANSGGRRPAVEVMVGTTAVATAIRDSKTYQIDNIIQTSGEIGMISMEKSLVEMVRAGTITTEQAMTFANRPDDILTLLGKQHA